MSGCRGLRWRGGLGSGERNEGEEKYEQGYKKCASVKLRIRRIREESAVEWHRV